MSDEGVDFLDFLYNSAVLLFWEHCMSSSVPTPQIEETTAADNTDPSGLGALKKLDYIPCLDGLRAIACLLVFWEHLPQIGESRVSEWLEKVKEAVHPGHMGVTIFFVLSGFLITRILLKDKVTSPSFRRFYAKRMLRIFPIYYIALAVMTVLHRSHFVGWAALYCQNYYFSFSGISSPAIHTWSLAVEEHFYLLWPMLVLLLPIALSRKIAVFGLPILSLILCVLSFAIFDNYTFDSLTAHGTHSGILALSFGSAMAYFETNIRAEKNRRWFVVAIGLVVLSLVLLVLPRMVSALKPIQKIPFHWAGALVSAAIVLVLLVWANRKNWIVRIFEFRLLRFIGTISYGLYLYHLLLFHAFGIVPQPFVTVFDALWATAAVFVLATISYYVIERPLIQLKRHLK